MNSSDHVQPKISSKDPVCGMEEDPKNAGATFEYKGTLYPFCCSGCMARFRENPEKYLNPGPRPAGG